MHGKYFAAMLVALALAGPSTGNAADDAKALQAQAEAAYDRKDFAVSAGYFAQAVATGDHSASTYYNLACVYALSGDPERAFEALARAIESGFSGSSQLRFDPDLKSLHADPRWQASLDRIDALHPEAPYQRLLEDQGKSVPARYLPVRRALAAGLPPPPPNQSSFMQFYGTLASMMGEYDEARAVYRAHTPPDPDPAKLGFSRAVPANKLILERARGRQAVFLNESHGNAQTRAATYTLLGPLRREGFQYLALETLATPRPEPAGPTACAAPKLGDAKLPERGYPTRITGYYTSEPVYAEIIREALRLGYTLVSYDGGGDRGPREQHEAEMIACLFKADPKARVVVIGGFGHISERSDDVYPGGLMGFRFKQLTGIDPLTVSSSHLLDMDPATLQFPKADMGRSAQSYALLNSEGAPYGSDRFDLIVHVRGPAHRNDNKGSWLELGGHRKRTPITAAGCHGKTPCLVEARDRGEGDDAIPSDRCVIGRTDAPGCNLYLRPGQYRIVAMDENETVLDSGGITVRQD